MTFTLTAAELAAVTSVWGASGRELTAVFGGTSMLPSIAPGLRLVLHCGAEPEVGDVTAYLGTDHVVVHRLVARSTDEGWFLAWGDANALPDPPFDRQKLVGTIRAIERNGTLMPLPPPPRSLKRDFLLRLIAPSSSSQASLERRVRVLYRIRTNLSLPVISLFFKVLKRLVHRTA